MSDDITALLRSLVASAERQGRVMDHLRDEAREVRAEQASAREDLSHMRRVAPSRPPQSRRTSSQNSSSGAHRP